MRDPDLIHSGLSRRITLEGHDLAIEIYRLENTGWSLEVVDEYGTSTVWDDLFETDQDALNQVMNTIEEEGLGAFLDNSNVVPFPRS